MLSDLPKEVTLKDGTKVTLRLMVKDDFVKLLKFFRALPEEDRMFLRVDVTDREVVHKRCQELDYELSLPIMVVHNDEIVGDATLYMRKYGWLRDVGRVRVVIARSMQKKGLGTIVIRELFSLAVEQGLDKLEARIMSNQQGAIRAFEKVGFVQEAVLHNHVTDLLGNKHDLVIMTNSVEALWQKMEDLFHDTEMRMRH